MDAQFLLLESDKKTEVKLSIKFKKFSGAIPATFTCHGNLLRDINLCILSKCPCDRKITPFFSSDFESLFAYHRTGKILSFDVYPKSVYLKCKFWISRSAITDSRSELTDWTSEGWIQGKVTSKAH